MVRTSQQGTRPELRTLRALDAAPPGAEHRKAKIWGASPMGVPLVMDLDVDHEHAPRADQKAT